MIDKLKQLINIFSLVADNHKEINSFSYSSNSLTPENVNFPLLQVNCTSIEKLKATNSENGYPSTIFNIYIRVIDRHNDIDRESRENNTHQIIDSIVNLIETDEYFRGQEIELANGTVYLLKEVDNTTHKTIGWSTTLRLLVRNWGGSCGTPISFSGVSYLE